MPDTPMPHITHDRTEVPVTKMEKEIWKESIKMYVKDDREL